MTSSRLDLTLLDATTTDADVDHAIDRATRERFAAIVVPPACARRAVGCGVEVISVVGYPLGLNKPTVKAIEATSLAKDGVAALEITPRATSLVSGDLAALRAELLEIARGARAASPTIVLAVHIGLDFTALSTIASLAKVIAQSACDGAVFESASIEALLAGVGAAQGSGIRIKAIARGATWVDSLQTSGADRVGVASFHHDLSS